VIESGQVFEKLGAKVTVRLYPGMAHTVSGDELESVRELVASI
jgi:phospholipase/carboxylesterase